MQVVELKLHRKSISGGCWTGVLRVTLPHITYSSQLYLPFCCVFRCDDHALDAINIVTLALFLRCSPVHRLHCPLTSSTVFRCSTCVCVCSRGMTYNTVGNTGLGRLYKAVNSLWSIGLTAVGEGVNCSPEFKPSLE